MKKLKWFCAVAAAVLALLQFTNPARTNPPIRNDFLAAISPPAGVAALFRSACYDCHSHETKWPWYSRVAPVSWGIVSDVNRARSRLTLSAWPDDDGDRAVRKLEAMSEEIRSGDMPPRKYTMLHPEARLTTGQRRDLANWLASQATRAKSPTGSSVAPSPTAVSGENSLGRNLFLKNCAHCHGADAHGDEGPDLHKLDWTAEQITTRIRNGKKGEMTAFAGKLSPNAINAVATYVRGLRP